MVALSSLEGEYMSLSLGIHHAIWVCQFLSDVGFGVPQVVIQTDSMSTIVLAEDHQFHSRSKHIDICHHFLRDIISRGWVSVVHVAGTENLADGLTKALPRSLFRSLMDSLMGRG